MRLSSILLGLLSLLAWCGLTLVCSAVAFWGARTVQIENGVDGIPLPDLMSIASRPTATVSPLIFPTIGTESTPSSADVTLVPEMASATATLAPSDTLDATAEDVNVLVRGALSRVGPQKITVLLLGIDQRSAVESSETEFFRTDTMMLVQIDPIRRTAGMLSLPRDLYVDIPGFKKGRINTANYLGDSNRLPIGGTGLAMETIKANFGMDVDYYVLVNFEVFTTVVDTLLPNGVEICVQESIYDDHYPDEGYGTIVVSFDPGCQALNSERLLQYARTRATQGSDFDRARRQQEVITAVQDQLVSAGGLASLVARAPVLWAEVSQNLRTDLTFEEALDLALIVSTIDRDAITTSVVGPAYVTFETNEAGEQVLAPIPSEITRLIQETFNPTPDLSVDEMRTMMQAENAQVVVLNDTTTAGLANTVADWLRAQGVTVSLVSNTTTPSNGLTVLRNVNGKTWTTRYIGSRLGLPTERVTASTGEGVSGDVVLIVGADIQTYLAQAGNG